MSELLVEVTIPAVCCNTVCCYITNLFVWIFEYLGGPTFKWDGLTFEWGGPTAIFSGQRGGQRGLKNTPTPLFEQPLKFITPWAYFQEPMVHAHIVNVQRNTVEPLLKDTPEMRTPP